MFSNAHKFVINGGSFYNVENGSRDTGFEALRGASVFGAFHDSAERYPPPKCHPGTREAVVTAITSWSKKSGRSDNVLWLYGPAGAGKSAIAQTMAENCRDTMTLAGSFFFSRAHGDRDNERSFVATLAYQITMHIPATKRFIVQAIERDPSILSKSIEIQLQKLLIEPIKRADGWFRFLFKRWPRIVIIDGLDECQDHEAQCRILRILHNVTKKNVPLRFLLASRPEPRIRDSFDLTELRTESRRIGLDDSYQAREDVRHFLEDGFAEILRKHRQLGTMANMSESELWPSTDVLEILVFKSSGYFIYASTVLKFIDDHREHPTKRLNDILQIRNPLLHSPLAELDLLYMQVLSSVFDIESTMKILGTVLVLKDSVPASLIEKLLGLYPGEFYALTADIHSLLNIPHPDHTTSESVYVAFHHASFNDFLLDQSRSGGLFINVERVHAELMSGCVRIINELVNTISIQETWKHDNIIHYAVNYWHEHFLAANTEDIEVLHYLEDLDILKWAMAVVASPVPGLIVQVPESIMCCLKLKNCPNKLDKLKQRFLDALNKSFLSILDQHPDIALVVVTMLTHKVPEIYPDYVLRDLLKLNKGVLWLSKICTLAPLLPFRQFLEDPKCSGVYHCDGLAHSRVCIALLDYMMGPTINQNQSLEEDESFHYAWSNLLFHLHHASMTERFDVYMKDVVMKMKLSRIWDDHFEFPEPGVLSSIRELLETKIQEKVNNSANNIPQ